MSKTREEHTQEMRERTGNVTSEDPFVGFFYLLLRDTSVPAGDIESMVRECEDDKLPCIFTNGLLANYAKDIVDRLREKERLNDPHPHE